MSLTQTYYVAHTARAKLSKEASKGDHNLRLLVGHANLLDGLMLDLANAEREQESWFNKTVQNNKATDEQPKAKHIQWADTIPEEVEEAVEEEFYAEDSDDEDDEDTLPSYAHTISLRRPAVFPTSNDEDEEMEDDDDYSEDLALTRTSSHSLDSPPELLHEDSDSESEDEMPPSPPTTEIQLDAFSEAQRKHAIATTSFYNSKSESPEQDFIEQGYYLPQRQTAIAAY